MENEKRNRNLFNLLSIGLAIVLSGLSYYLKDNPKYSMVLLILGITIIFMILFFNYMLPFIAAKVSLFKDPKIFFNSKQTGAWAEKTYEIAREEGGEIYATHIYQHRVPIEKDFAVNKLKEKIKSKLEFHRILIFDNQKDEIEWINNLFSIQNSQLKIVVYFWKYVNLTINRFTVGLIPRINILAFKNLNGNKYRTVIGLEKVRSASDVDTRYLNLSICSSKKSIFDLVKKYYENIQNHPEVENATNIETYKIKKNHFPLKPTEQGILKDLISYSHKTEGILHFGAFGHTALTLNNICNIKRNLNHYSDIDVLLVTKTSTLQVKEEIEKLFNNNDIDVVFGFNDDYFYHFRNPLKTTIDVEIFEKDSNFYEINKLLGYSIFSNYYTLYSFEHKTLAELISIPRKSLTKEERADLIITDRKGINDFIKNINSDNSNVIDPRRVLTHNIKNYNWFLTGYHTYDTENSVDFMNKYSLLDKQQIKFIIKTLAQSDAEIMGSYNEIMKKTISLLEAIKTNILKTSG